MSVTSYLAHPVDGQKNKLIDNLGELPFCQILPAENDDVIVVVSEAESTGEEVENQKRIESIESLQCLTMVFAHTGEGVSE